MEKNKQQEQTPDEGPLAYWLGQATLSDIHRLRYNS